MKNSILILTIIGVFFFVSCNKEVNKTPVVKWTAELPKTTKIGLRFDLLQNMQTTTLYDAKSETGTYSHHPHITNLKGVIYTLWSNP